MSERPGQLTVGAPSAIGPSLQVPAAQNWHDYGRPAGRPEAPPLGQGRRQTADAPDPLSRPVYRVQREPLDRAGRKGVRRIRQFQPGSLPDHQCSIDCRAKSQVVCTPGGAQPRARGLRVERCGLRVRRAGCGCGLAGTPCGLRVRACGYAVRVAGAGLRVGAVARFSRNPGACGSSSVVGSHVTAVPVPGSRGRPVPPAGWFASPLPAGSDGRLVPVALGGRVVPVLRNRFWLVPGSVPDSVPAASLVTGRVVRAAPLPSSAGRLPVPGSGGRPVLVPAAGWFPVPAPAGWFPVPPAGWFRHRPVLVPVLGHRLSAERSANPAGPSRYPRPARKHGVPHRRRRESCASRNVRGESRTLREEMRRKPARA
jgi:hypothetical protein